MAGALESGDEGPRTLVILYKDYERSFDQKLSFFHSLVFRGQYY